MKKQNGIRIRIIILVVVFINMWTFKTFSQTGLTLEQALSTAESNSPTILKTRLNLIRSQENLNAQNAALKSKFALSVNPVTYSAVFRISTPRRTFRVQVHYPLSSLFYRPMRLLRSATISATTTISTMQNSLQPE
jgi:hypothetical protein